MAEVATTPFFSIVMPTYNRAAFISSSVSSVINQLFQDWELIIIDDASTDNTAAVLLQFRNDPRIRIFRNETNRERSISRNNGISKSRGSYVCFLDSDDLYLPGHLQGIHTHIQKLGGPVAFFFTHCIKRHLPQGREEKHFVKFDSGNPVASIIRDNIPVNNVAIHRSIFRDLTFPESLSINEDVWLFAQIASSFSVHPIDQYESVWQIHPANSINRYHDIYAPQLHAVGLMLHDHRLSRAVHELKRREGELLADRTLFFVKSRKFGNALVLLGRAMVRRVPIRFVKTVAAHIIYGVYPFSIILENKLKKRTI